MVRPGRIRQVHPDTEAEVSERALLRLAMPAISQALIATRGNVTLAARELGVKRTTLHMWRKQAVEQGIVEEDPVEIAKQMAAYVDRETRRLVNETMARSIEDRMDRLDAERRALEER